MSKFFSSTMIDDMPALLKDSYSLRYQVYCLERKFLPAEHYPDQLETDEFDPQSLHLGAMDLKGELVGTVRLVQPSTIGLPMFKVCVIFSDAEKKLQEIAKFAEISRLSVSRRYRRRRGDGYYGTKERQHNIHVHEEQEDPSHGIDNPLLVVSLYKAIYQTSKRNGITHLLAATEKSLQRLLVRYKFPFRPIGPEVDYFGPVRPYILELKELDQKLSSHHVPIYNEFLDGLEPEFWPRLD